MTQPGGGAGSIVTVSTTDDLYNTLLTGAISPGDTVRIRGGTYIRDGFTCAISGTAAKRIVVEPYPGEHPIIDAPLDITGDYIDWKGTENKNSLFTDRSLADGGNGFSVQGDYVRVMNCIVHDFYQGLVSGQSVGIGLLVYGTLFFYNGNNSNLGHGLYPQNLGPIAKTFKDCIVFDNFGYGFHFYGAAGQARYMHIIGSVAFNNGSVKGVAERNILYDSSDEIMNPVLANVMTYRSIGEAHSIVGDSDNPTTSIEVYDSYLMEAGAGRPIWLLGSAVDISRLDGNTFIGNLDDLGFDQGIWANNTFLSSPPMSNQVFLRTNEYDSELANLIIYNWAGLDNIQVDVSSVFNAGDTINAHNVQDYFVDIQELTVAGDGTITVNMQAVNRSVATPVGWTPPATVFPDFGCFRLVRQ